MGFHKWLLERVLQGVLERIFMSAQMLEQSRCAFGNCRHLDEPGCAVRGEWERYNYYVALRMELQELADVAKTRATSKRQRQGALRYVLHMK